MDQQEKSLRLELETINKELENSSIYSSSDYPKIAKRRSDLEEIIDLFDKINKTNHQINQANNLINTGDKDLKNLAETEIIDLNSHLSSLTSTLHNLLIPKDPNDDKNAIIEIRAAAGGDEASLFAAELYRLYFRWSEIHHFTVELLNETPNEVGGYKEIIFIIKGLQVYKLLKFEAGVHRVQRIPTTESQGRIHTSTVTVAVLPEAEETDIEIDPKDLRIDVFRSGGHGGQSVNTTDSAVRITHIPTGIVVANQDEKSQIKNKAKALSVLRSRLLAQKIFKEQEEQSQSRNKLIGSGDRSEKIRTYNFPQDRITDHRINYSRSNINGALNGEIDDLINKLQEFNKNNTD